MDNTAINIFNFSLTRNTSLEQNEKGYFLILKTPIRILRISKTLFSILSMLQNRHELSDIIDQHPNIKQEQIIRILLTLTCKGYCQFNRSAELDFYPRVSIIIPTLDLSNDLIECLESLARLDYPEDKLEIIVVTDGVPKVSKDLSHYKIKLIQLNETKGPGTARNMGAQLATGEILAFLDSDCIANSKWLKDLVPFLEMNEIGAVGGFVDSYYKKGYLDRYEDVLSSLNIGSRVLFEGDSDSSFYVPTCNFIVKRKVFKAIGGFKDGMHVGEDVDFCWRMRDLGYFLLYIPSGKVAHKHRNQLLKMLRRRGFYGTSESILYKSHKDKHKRFPVPLFAGLSFLALVATILIQNPWILSFIFLFLGVDLIQKMMAVNRSGIGFSFNLIFHSTLRSFFSFYYFASFHLLRYYLILLLMLGFLFHPIWYFAMLVLILASFTDYIVKKPKLTYPVFLYFYTLEHLAYQIGVFWGCLKLKYFRSYSLILTRKLT
jgi:mycofactocin glycosyltransferase